MDITGIATMEYMALFIIALLVTVIGFYKYVYFISLGYGFSIAAMGIAMIIMFREKISFGMIAACILLGIYGVRLGGYLLIRELKTSAYNNLMKKEIKDGSTIKIGVKCAIWISCVLLYVFQISPIFFRLKNGGDVDVVCVIGICIMLMGILLEGIADLQKQKAKAKNPNRFCDKGLYRIVRCPNYLGEILFWSGVYITGITTFDGVGQWVIASIGYVGIVYIMFGGARRLEIRQNKYYGKDKEYQEYVKKTPILIPLIPLYSVEKYKWLIG